VGVKKWFNRYTLAHFGKFWKRLSPSYSRISHVRYCRQVMRVKWTSLTSHWTCWANSCSLCLARISPQSLSAYQTPDWLATWHWHHDTTVTAAFRISSFLVKLIWTQDAGQVYWCFSALGCCTLACCHNFIFKCKQALTRILNNASGKKYFHNRRAHTSAMARQSPLISNDVLWADRKLFSS